MSIKNKQGYTVDIPGTEFFPPRKPFKDIPQIISDIKTRYGRLFIVYCVSDKDLWTCVNESIMSLYDLKVELVRSIPLKSENNAMRHSSE